MISFKLQTRAIIWLMILTACLMSYMLRVNMSINLIAMVEPTSGMASLTSDPLPTTTINNTKLLYLTFGTNETNNDTTMIPMLSTGNSMQQIQSECLAINNHGNDSMEKESHERLTASSDYGTRYEWNSKVQGLILGSFFWGYIVSSMPGGLLAEKIGPTRIIGVSIAASGLLTILTPVAASWHYGYVIGIRVLLGLLGGVVYPALHCLIARWAPPIEKGKFIGALMGGTLGTVITWPLLGTILEHWGWTWAFFVPGGLAILWCLLWFLLVADTPDLHPRVGDDEKFYIIKSLAEVGCGTTMKGMPPYRAIFSSVPFWALTMLHFGNLWGLYLLLTAGPKFMSEVLGFNLGHSGILASLPYLARMIFGLIFGSIGDAIRQSKFMTVTTIRKSFILFSHVIPGLFLIAQTMIGCDQTLAVVFITLALGMNGASTVTNLQNSQDLSTNYAGTVYGIVNCIGGTTGFITPMLTGWITEKRNGLHEWHIIFWIGASVYILCGIIFCFFGSGEQQEWNNANTVPTTAVLADQQMQEKPVETTDATGCGIVNAAYSGDHAEQLEERTKV